MLTLTNSTSMLLGSVSVRTEGRPSIHPYCVSVRSKEQSFERHVGVERYEQSEEIQTVSSVYTVTSRETFSLLTLNSTNAKTIGRNAEQPTSTTTRSAATRSYLRRGTWYRYQVHGTKYLVLGDRNALASVLSPGTCSSRRPSPRIQCHSSTGMSFL